MKKFILSLVLICIATVLSFASDALYDFSLVGLTNQPYTGAVVTKSANYTQNLMYGKTVDYLSFQAVYSTPTYSVTIATLTAINSITNVISSTQSYPSGFALLYTSSSYNGGSLTNNATYYALNPTSTRLQLSATQTDTTAVILGTGTVGSFTLTPINIQASSPFSGKWQYSNNGNDWYDSTQSSVTVLGTQTPTNYFWDFGFTTYKYIRFNLTAGSFGAIKILIRGYGKSIAY
jgi:hypothetical protein